jgi:hypothetical protein
LGAVSPTCFRTTEIVLLRFLRALFLANPNLQGFLLAFSPFAREPFLQHRGNVFREQAQTTCSNFDSLAAVLLVVGQKVCNKGLRPFLASWLNKNSEIAPAILSPPATEGSMAFA